VRVCARYGDHDVSNYRVIVGEFDRHQPDADELAFGLSRLVVHDKYVGQQTLWDNDIALMEIDGLSPVTMCSRPICLPPATGHSEPFRCYATGWGLDIGKAMVTTTIRLRFDCSSTARRAFDDLCYDYMCELPHRRLNK